jgi:DNA modification methylase
MVEFDAKLNLFVHHYNAYIVWKKNDKLPNHAIHFKKRLLQTNRYSIVSNFFGHTLFCLSHVTS